MLSERAKGIRLPPMTATLRVLLFISRAFLFGGDWGSGRGSRAGAEAGLDGGDQKLGGGVGAQRLGPQPPAGERLGGAEQGGGERLDFGPCRGPVALRQLRLHRGRRRTRGCGRGRRRPGRRRRRWLGWVSSKSTAQAARSESRKAKKAWTPAPSASPGLALVATAAATVSVSASPGPLHAGDVEPFLVAEVVVEQRLGHPDRRRDLLHRHLRVAARREQLMGDAERLLHPLVARKS